MKTIKNISDSETNSSAATEQHGHIENTALYPTTVSNLNFFQQLRIALFVLIFEMGIQICCYL